MDNQEGEDIFRLLAIGREASRHHVECHHQIIALMLHPDKLRHADESAFKKLIVDHSYVRFLVNLGDEDLGQLDHQGILNSIESIKTALVNRINPAVDKLKNDKTRNEYCQKNIYHGRKLKPQELFLRSHCEACKTLYDKDCYKYFKVERIATDPHIRRHLELFKAPPYQYNTIYDVFLGTFATKELRVWYDEEHPGHGKKDPNEEHPSHGKTISNEGLVLCDECNVDRYRILKISRDATMEHIKAHQEAIIEELVRTDPRNSPEMLITMVYEKTFADKELRNNYDRKYPDHGLFLVSAERLLTCRDCINAINSNITQQTGHVARDKRNNSKRKRGVVGVITGRPYERRNLDPHLLPLDSLLLKLKKSNEQSITYEEFNTLLEDVLIEIPNQFQFLIEDMMARHQDSAGLKTSFTLKHPCRDFQSHIWHRELWSEFYCLFQDWSEKNKHLFT